VQYERGDRFCLAVFGHRSTATIPAPACWDSKSSLVGMLARQRHQKEIVAG
jgi:hypothetical protein